MDATIPVMAKPSKRATWVISFNKFVAASLILSFTPLFCAPVLAASEDPAEDVSSAMPDTEGDAFLQGGGAQTLSLGDGDDQLPPYLRDSGPERTRADQSAATGAFTYDYAITVPPGRNGMEPHLSLSYSSQDRDEASAFGYGWNISIPYIERYNVEGMQNLYSTTSPHFYSSLSGELATTSDSSVFLARSDDGSYLRYALAGNIWMVTDKNGVVYRFGTSTAARQDDPGDSGRVYKWMLQETMDANGNTVTYGYAKDSGQIYPESIRYTGSGGAPGVFSVEFAKSLRATATATTSPGGFGVRTRYKIDQIRTKVNGEWVRSYDFAYTHGDNGSRLLLAGVTESGRDDGGAVISLPAAAFSYATSSPAWASPGWTVPVEFTNDQGDRGVTLADVNGDSLTDLVESKYSSPVITKHTYLGTGTGWAENTLWNAPCIITEYGSSSIRDKGTRIVDVNGDLLPDFVCNSSVFLNTGSGWATSTVWTNPETIVENNKDVGTRFSDVNGDGPADIVRSYVNNPNGGSVTYTKKVYLNNGHGWTYAPSWQIPVLFSARLRADTGARIADVNNDGLDDVIGGSDSQYGPTDMVYLNTGSGWATSTEWAVPIPPGGGTSTRLADFNNDGLVDIGYNSWVEFNGANSLWSGNAVYLNTGTGWALDPARTLPAPFIANGLDAGTRIGEADGNGPVDFITSGTIGGSYYHNYNFVYLGTGGMADLLTRVVEPAGGAITASYKSSASYRGAGGAMLNPGLPVNLETAEGISRYAGIGATSTDSYAYAGGRYYFGSPFDRRIAGFGTTTKTDAAGNVTKTFFHQGDASATSTGEYLDDQSKIGKAYRSESYDDAGHLYSLEVDKWETYNRGGKADFVRKTQMTVLDYDGDSDHADKAETYAYDDGAGNLTQKVEWGRVNAGADGSFADTGTDKFTTAYAYAASSTAPFSLLSRETRTDQASSTVRETKNYYDALSFGSLNRGNLTKQESWIAASTTIDTEKTYDARGLVLTEKDPRDKQTIYEYDPYGLYPATTTNALGQSTAYLYDYSSGKPRQTTNPNGRTYHTVYDPLDRVLEEWQPDTEEPSALVMKSAYAYTDTGMPRRAKRTDYLDDAVSADSYTYFDGFGRKVEELAEAEGSNRYAVRTFAYDGRGLLVSESQPYFASGTGFTGTSSPPALPLRTRYAYDPLKRVSSVENAVGETEYAYDDWKTTVTDALGRAKDLVKDAYGNLASVVEHVGGSSQTTAYEYDGNKNLTKITDAQGNIRDFAYDGLGRRLSATDLHAGADATYGIWSYNYDASGNLASSTDPKGQTTVFTYDDLNRPLAEDFAGSPSIEVAYTYDACTEGKGLLCTASTTETTAAFAYDPLGRMETETDTIGGVSEITRYGYDRLGNLATLGYPNGIQARYTYNSAGQLERIAQRQGEAGTFADVVSDFDYAPTGKVKYAALGNGTESSYTYAADQLYRLTNIRTVLPQAGDSLRTDGDGEDSEQAGAFGKLLGIRNGRLALASNSPYLLAFLGMGQEEAGEEASVEPIVPSDLDGHDAISPEEGAATTEEVPETESRAASTTQPLGESLVPEAAVGETASTTTDERAAPDGDSYASLKALPFDAPELRLRAPVDRHLGTREISDGIVRYAYRTDENVDDLPASEETRARAKAAGVAVKGEIKSQRTKHARVFATDKPNTFVAEIVSGDPQYYEDEKGGWWVADYGITTADSYEAQKRAQGGSPGILEAIVGFLFPKRARADTGTFYPDPDPETSSVDGYVYKDHSSNWNSVHNATNGINANSDAAEIIVSDELGVASGALDYGIRRGFLLFDTSSLPDSVPVIDATLSLYMTGVTAGGSEKRLYVASSSPSSAASLVSQDFDMIGSTSYGVSDGTYAGNTYEPIALNANGLASISRTGVTKLSVRTYNDFNNIAPTDATELVANFASADDTGTGHDPKLVVVYDTAPAGPTALLTEGQTDPVHVTDLTPEFSALFTDADAGDLALAYRIQLAASSAFSSVYWDTGMTALASSTPSGMRIPDISYAGPALASSTPYYWRIKLWDADTQSEWSSVASFEIPVSFPPGAPASLLTEGLTNPAGITDYFPEFSAVYADPDSGDSARYFQIQVATSTGAWSAPVWDSAKAPFASSTAPGTRTEDITYAGDALAAGIPYYWRMRVWDDHDVDSDWSAAASYVIGTPPSGTTIQDIYFTYDAVGNVTGIDDYSDTQAAKSAVFAYDDLDRLTVASTTAAASLPYRETYGYSAIGNLTGKSGQGSYAYAGTGYANPHAPTSVASTTLSYDNDGNVVAHGPDSFAWDYRNRLAASSDGSATTTYAYDHVGNRAAKVSGGIATLYPNKYFELQGATTTAYIWAGDGLVAAIEGNGSATTTSYMHPDHLGSTNVVSDDAGQLAKTLDYYPYGSERVDAGAVDLGRTFIGQFHDDESDLSYLNARYYDGGRGQFLSQDPSFLAMGDAKKVKELTQQELNQILMDPQTLNSYSYVRNNPIINKDPSGNWYVYINGGLTYGFFNVQIGFEASDQGVNAVAGGGPSLGAEAKIGGGFSSGSMPKNAEVQVEQSVGGAVGVGYKYSKSATVNVKDGTNATGPKQDVSSSHNLQIGVGAAVSQTYTVHVPIIPGSMIQTAPAPTTPATTKPTTTETKNKVKNNR